MPITEIGSLGVGFLVWESKALNDLLRRGSVRGNPAGEVQEAVGFCEIQAVVWSWRCLFGFPSHPVSIHFGKEGGGSSLESPWGTTLGRFLQNSDKWQQET